MKTLVEQITAWEQQGRSFNSDIGKSVMRVHSKMWGNLERAQKAKFEASAVKLRDQRKCELDDKKDDLRVELRTRKDRLRQRAVGSGGCLSVSSCILSASQRKK